MTPPTLSREARDYLLKTANEAGMQSNDYLVATIIDMPLTPADPLDAVRARWKPKTRGGYEYEIFAERDGYLWGRTNDTAVCWTMNGRCEYRNGDPMGLVPTSPHAALIAELRREATQRKADLGKCRMADLMQQAADALEKQP